MNASRKKHLEILKLISMFRAQPCLWDNNLEESKSVIARKLALEEIAAKMNASWEDVRRKLHNLRSQYRRENIRMKTLNTNKPKWIYYNSLKFLSKTLKTKRTTTTTDPLESFSDIHTDDENTRFEESNFKQLPLRLSHPTTLQQKRRQNEIETFNDDRPLNQKDASHRVIVLPRQTQQQQDEYDVFGENVANELRSLKNNKSLQHLLKFKILQAILDVNKAICDSKSTQDSYEVEETQMGEFIMLSKE